MSLSIYYMCKTPVLALLFAKLRLYCRLVKQFCRKKLWQEALIKLSWSAIWALIRA